MSVVISRDSVLATSQLCHFRCHLSTYRSHQFREMALKRYVPFMLTNTPETTHTFIDYAKDMVYLMGLEEPQPVTLIPALCTEMFANCTSLTLTHLNTRHTNITPTAPYKAGQSDLCS